MEKMILRPNGEGPDRNFAPNPAAIELAGSTFPDALRREQDCTRFGKSESRVDAVDEGFAGLPAARIF